MFFFMPRPAFFESKTTSVDPPSFFIRLPQVLPDCSTFYRQPPLVKQLIQIKPLSQDFYFPPVTTTFSCFSCFFSFRRISFHPFSFSIQQTKDKVGLSATFRYDVYPTLVPVLPDGPICPNGWPRFRNPACIS